MNCRVGMTTDVEERKRYWKNQKPNLRDWKILGTYNTKREAQEAEKRFAQKYGCDCHPGGRGNAHAKWYVYKFNY